jgi:aminoglycoside phosphotransferase (APT) family kinase protein
VTDAQPSAPPTQTPAPPAQTAPPPASQWTVEVDITLELAADLIRSQFPEVAASQVTVLATGWDNIAFVVDGQWLFRFPRREIAVPGVMREIAVLPKLAARLPLPVPDPKFAGQPSARYPWPFFGARLLPGTELADAGLTDTELAPAAVAVGEFLRVLHDPDLVPLTDGDGLPEDPMRRASPPVRAVRARETLDRLIAAGIVPPGSDAALLLDRASHAPDPAGPLVISHGDLHIRHLLVDAGGAATGVIDWGDLCLADPAVDLSMAYFGFAGPQRAALLAAYARPVTAERELAARTLAISLAASLAEYAADDNRPVLLSESLAGLTRATAP